MKLKDQRESELKLNQDCNILDEMTETPCVKYDSYLSCHQLLVTIIHIENSPSLEADDT
jgi:hypothetical protein